MDELIILVCYNLFIEIQKDRVIYVKTVVVVGGGITGITAMHYLHKMKRERGLDLRLILVEKNEHLGGKIHTVKDGEFTMTVGNPRRMPVGADRSSDTSLNYILIEAVQRGK